MALFEIACLVIVGVTLTAMARACDPRELVLDYTMLAVAGLLGEESCIRVYGFYGYADSWHARILDVPALVPLIWPLVVLSGREVARVLLGPGASRFALAAATGGIVMLDASLVEVVAVHAGLWRWAEPGHLGVPLPGIVGWGWFAFGATWPRRRALALLSSLAVTHGLVLVTWWGLFRWTLRGDLGLKGFAVVGAAAAVALAAAARARQSGRAMTADVWIPRVLAASLFVLLLVRTSAGEVALWCHAALVAAPYLVLTSLRARSPSHAVARAVSQRP